MSAVLNSPMPMPFAGGRTRGFESTAREIDDAEVALHGTLPPWLRGRLLLNGPALWELPKGRLQHWFDGYAMLHALHFGAGAAVRYRSRFIQSQSYTRSMAAGRPVFGEFGTANPAGLLSRLRGPQASDNPAVVMSRHGRRWLAVTETPTLTYFDPRSLATEERVELGRSAARLHLMSAHGHTLPDGSYLNVGTTLGPRCTMKVFRLPPGSTQPEVIAAITTARSGYTHALALAPGKAIVWETALRARPLSMRFGSGSYASNFNWMPEGGSRLHAIDLTSGAVSSWDIPPMMAFHATQAWVEGGELVLDLATYDDGTVFDDLTLQHRRADAPLRGRLHHVRYRLRSGEAQAMWRALPTPLELQQVHPDRIGVSRASVCWGIGNSAGHAFGDHVLRVDGATGRELARYRREGATHLEPLFVPEPDGATDDAGVLLIPTLGPHDETTVIAVVDAHTMLARAELRTPQVVPFGFHAAFDAD